MKTGKTTFLWMGLIALLLSMNLQKALAWGSTGHRAIAEIAYQQLQPETKDKLKKILGDDYLPLVANWADNVRSEHDNPLAKIPHYVNMPFDVNYDDSEKSERGDIVTYLNQFVATLTNKKATEEEKAVALKFIVHLVGDLHQPMHVGLAEDLGGNKVDVLWFGEKSNLHKVWDENLIDNSNLSYTELARFAGKPTAKELVDLYTGTFTDWVDETHVYTKEIYDNLGDKNYGYEYRYTYLPLVYQQIQKAGYRLGFVLNELMKDV